MAQSADAVDKTNQTLSAASSGTEREMQADAVYAPDPHEELSDRSLLNAPKPGPAQ
jgi:hypothetical protein